MLRNTPASYKKEYPWLKEVDSLALANAQMHLESAFHKFFREPSAGFPRFKSKKSSRKSYTTNVVNGNIFLEGNYLKLPKMTAVRMKLHRPISEKWKLKSVTVSRVPSGKYFASLLFCCGNQAAKKDRQKNLLGSILRCRECVCFLPLKEPNIRCSTGTQRKSLHGNRESCPDVRKAVRIIRSRRKELHCAMKKSEIREKIFSINSVPVLPRASMQYAWKIWIWKGWQEDFILEKAYMIMDMACFCLCWNINWRNAGSIW